MLNHCRSLFGDTVLRKNIYARLHFFVMLLTLTPLFQLLVVINSLPLHWQRRGIRLRHQLVDLTVLSRCLGQPLLELLTDVIGV